MADILVRVETTGDYMTIHGVESEAFGRREEAVLVDALRSHGVLALSLVAEIDGLSGTSPSRLPRSWERSLLSKQ